MSNERVNIFIDGGNFYHLALRKLGSSESNFDFEKFAVFLEQKRIVSGIFKIILKRRSFLKERNKF